MVVAAPSDTAYILQLIQEFDKPLENRDPLERKLRYVKANEILPVIVDILQDTGTGQTQLPGGLISGREDRGESGIPLIKDIPLIGQAAKTTTVDTRCSKLMIFIQPVGVASDQEAVYASYDEDVRSEIGEAAATQFPEPGVPTIQHQAEVIEEYTEPNKDNNPFKKFGQKLFGKKKESREPLPYNP